MQIVFTDYNTVPLVCLQSQKVGLEDAPGTVRPGCTPSGLTVGLCPWQQQRQSGCSLCL